MPADGSTWTSWPARRSACTPSGVTLTRYSWSLTSFGTPMIMGSPLFRPTRTSYLLYREMCGKRTDAAEAAAAVDSARRGVVRFAPRIAGIGLQAFSTACDEQEEAMMDAGAG